MSYALYHKASQDCSRCVTNRYSTSFSSGIKLFNRQFRNPIYDIYGFVRLADEIVDTFYDHDQYQLFQSFRKDLDLDFERGLSLNPILQSYIIVCRNFNIEKTLTDAFLDSMEMDLTKIEYTKAEYDRYIYGSAEVIGLMCLKVFCNGDNEQYQKLQYYARKLGSAFQKVNFLRDMKSDFHDRGRVYFPNLKYHQFNSEIKRQIEADIQLDFEEGYKGILKLPRDVRLGVLVAYKYYEKLLKRIIKCDSNHIQEERVRVHDFKKLLILFSSLIRYKLKVI